MNNTSQFVTHNCLFWKPSDSIAISKQLSPFTISGYLWWTSGLHQETATYVVATVRHLYSRTLVVVFAYTNCSYILPLNGRFRRLISMCERVQVRESCRASRSVQARLFFLAGTGHTVLVMNLPQVVSFIASDLLFDAIWIPSSPGDKIL
jgi:hypothetical protein